VFGKNAKVVGRSFRQLLVNVPSLSPKLLASLAARLAD
jgi:hypothetical protein